jgi:uncharacterized protein YaaR (DUF327 family)
MAIRIEGNSGKRPTSSTGRIENQNSKVQSSDSMQFGSQLGRSFSEAQDDYLHKLAKDIAEQGSKLADRVDVAELKAYKRMVSDFLEESVRGFGKFSKESFLDRRGRHRVYATVKSVNDRLEDLTREVLKTEKDNLAIMGRIQDIRGLVLDLLL